MISSWPLLSVITFLPLTGVLFLLLIRGNTESVATNARLVALWVSGFTFLLSLSLYFGFDAEMTGYQFEERADWISGSGISYHLGVDGISMPFILLSTFLTPLSILASWKSITHRVRDYMIAFLVLEVMMVGMFASLDMLMFYLFFEGVLIPMFIIIGVWGGAERVYAAFKFFLYTLLGSVLMLVCMLVMFHLAGTTDIPALSAFAFSPELQFWLFLGFFCLICGQSADVAGAYLAARCPCASPDSRFHDSGGRFVENGRIWLYPLFPADVPGCFGIFCALHFCVVSRGGDLHFSGCAGTKRYEKAYCLFFCGTYGFCDHRHLYPDRTGYSRRNVPDDLARAGIGRAVFLCRGGI